MFSRERGPWVPTSNTHLSEEGVGISLPSLRDTGGGGGGVGN